jgi:spore germination protein GerM
VTPRSAHATASRTTRRIWALVAVTVAGWATVSCGIPTDHSPRLLDRHDMPAALSVGTTTTQVHGTGAFQSLKIFLVRSTTNRTILQPVTVEVAEKTTIVSQAEAVLDALIADHPSSRPATASLTNAIPSNLRVLDASLDGNVLDLDISHLDSSIVSLQQKVAFAQIVYTLTELNGIDAVKFSIVDQPAQVPIDSGTSPAGAAITRGNFRQLYPDH